jgi:hypothetical protein
LEAPLCLSVFVFENLLKALLKPLMYCFSTQKMEGGVPQLLARVRRLLRSKSWETRVAVSAVLQLVLSVLLSPCARLHLLQCLHLLQRRRHTSSV